MCEKGINHFTVQKVLPVFSSGWIMFRTDTTINHSYNLCLEFPKGFIFPLTLIHLFLDDSVKPQVF